jgi:hypothetical protein
VIHTIDTTRFMGNGFISSHYMSKDVNSSLTYFITRSKYSDYYQASSEKEYFKQLVDASREENDSLLRETTLTIDGWPGREILVQKKGNHTLKRTRLILSGSNLYELMLYVPESDAFSAEVNHFFDSFRPDKSLVSGNIFTKKGDKLFADLKSKNPDTHKEARESISDFTFVKTDLPDLYAALTHSYMDDTMHWPISMMLLRYLLSKDFIPVYLNHNRSNR